MISKPSFTNSRATGITASFTEKCFGTISLVKPSSRNDLPAITFAASFASGTPIALLTKGTVRDRSEEHTSELQSRRDLVCRLLLEKKKIPHAPDSPSLRESLVGLRR